MSEHKKIMFRHHRGSLDDSMKTLKEFSTIKDLIDYLTDYVSENWLIKPDTYNIVSRYYGYDNRVKWSTYIVYIKDQGILGFSNVKLDNN